MPTKSSNRNVPSKYQSTVRECGRLVKISGGKYATLLSKKNNKTNNNIKDSFKFLKEILFSCI